MEWLNYHHLLYFWTVARIGGITRASEDLRLTQATVSAQIKSLEQALGEKLFRRAGRRLALTTVATMLVRLEQRGLVSHRAEGRQYIYRSRVSPAEVRETVTRELLRNLFDGDVAAFVSQLLDARKLTREEVADLQRLVRNKARR